MIFNTVNTAPPHFTHGCFTVGSGPLSIIILGSCRVVPYLNYFHYLNDDNRYTLRLIDVVKFYYNADGSGADPEKTTAAFEQHSGLLRAIESCDWFIHEHTEHFGMFNTGRTAAKNIYQFGMRPTVDINIPNFHNIFIMFQELVDLDAAIKVMATEDMSTGKMLSEVLIDKIRLRGESRIEDFLTICSMTDLPEWGEQFKHTWRNERYWWTGNHVTNKFTTSVFRLMNDKFLHINLYDTFWDKCYSDDPYSVPCTPITTYDREAYHLTWPQGTVDLKV